MPSLRDSFIKMGGLRRRDSPLGETDDTHDFHVSGQADRQDVVGADHPARRRHLLAVDANLAAFHQRLRHGASLGEPGIAQPLVDPLGD